MAALSSPLVSPVKFTVETRPVSPELDSLLSVLQSTVRVGVSDSLGSLRSALEGGSILRVFERAVFLVDCLYHAGASSKSMSLLSALPRDDVRLAVSAARLRLDATSVPLDHLLSRFFSSVAASGDLVAARDLVLASVSDVPTDDRLPSSLEAPTDLRSAARLLDAMSAKLSDMSPTVVFVSRRSFDLTIDAVFARFAPSLVADNPHPTSFPYAVVLPRCLAFPPVGRAAGPLLASDTPDTLSLAVALWDTSAPAGLSDPVDTLESARSVLRAPSR
jgi:hypothetical protein